MQVFPRRDVARFLAPFSLDGVVRCGGVAIRKHGRLLCGRRRPKQAIPTSRSTRVAEGRITAQILRRSSLARHSGSGKQRQECSELRVEEGVNCWRLRNERLDVQTNPRARRKVTRDDLLSSRLADWPRELRNAPLTVGGGELALARITVRDEQVREALTAQYPLSPEVGRSASSSCSS